ncbi:SDR family NAD(P)-dependent oxidoreductase [Aspergillus puulaauensis]|uniref:Uncharacterized protein n=1 Tax=Aspergillus puulaauensis TaxID=1220207 RepID=A0A7R7XUG4_9EURO|nr:uncharacterized protein APUU_60834A [Aspergillus puulaauensis]BCS27786.1 hypothetical protein APUU_60834A [Aspergillus puulaauensis]
MSHYKDKIAVVTGAGRGIGRAVACEFAAAGAVVVLADITIEAQEATVAQLQKDGHKAFAYHCDVTSDSSVSSFASAVLKDVGCPDIIYNNAAIMHTGSILNAPIDNIRQDLDVNVLGYIRVVQQFLPSMVSRGSGWIINTASPNAFVPPPAVAENLMSYCITKAAEVSLSQSMAVTLLPKGIDISVVFPDITHTEAVNNLSGTASDEFHAGIAGFMQSQGRPAADVAANIVRDLRPDQFFTNVYAGFEKMLTVWAERKLDPAYNYLGEHR